MWNCTRTGSHRKCFWYWIIVGRVCLQAGNFMFALLLIIYILLWLWLMSIINPPRGLPADKYMPLHIYIYMYAYIYVCIKICTFMYSSIHIYIYIYMCACLCLHIYMCTSVSSIHNFHIYIYIDLDWTSWDNQVRTLAAKTESRQFETWHGRTDNSGKWINVITQLAMSTVWIIQGLFSSM